MPLPPAAPLLAWYDRHRRTLPFRNMGSGPPDPYRVWLSEVMLQQTTVAAVGPRFARFLARFPDVAALAAAPEAAVMEEWAGLGYYARARNLHACARAVAEGGGFPRTAEGLRALPGIGAYTAAAIAAIAFDAPVVPADGNVERVVARLTAEATPLPAAKPRLAALARASWRMRRPAPGRGISPRPVRPRRHHLHAEGAGLRALPLAGRLPGAGPGHPGRIAAQGGETRPAAASWRAFPADRCGRPGAAAAPPAARAAGRDAGTPRRALAGHALGGGRGAGACAGGRAGWRRVPGLARHGFTHFELEMALFAATVSRLDLPPGTEARPLAEAAAVLPTVMRKLLALAGPN